MITVQFSCEACGLKDHKVLAPSRLDPGISVVYWVEEVVGQAIADEHVRVSPHCKATHVTQLFIPICKDKEGWLGKPE